LARAAIANVPFVEAFYLKKASQKGRMLTLGGKLLDFAVKVVNHRKRARRHRVAVSVRDRR